jgi:type II secretory pathway component GspD/PulD (secretin)
MRRVTTGSFFLLAIALLASLAVPDELLAQNGGGGFRGGRGNRSARFEQFRRMMEQQMQAVPPVTNPEKPKEEKKDEKPAETPKETGPKPLTRQPAVENPAALRDQQIKEEGGLVSFNFDEAPWPFVLEELARVSKLNLDWQQLPGDSLNLRSNAKYTIAKARDMINEHLLARGYSILLDTKTATMTVVNLDTLNTALVPRVSPDDLEGLPPHDLVKVSFHLDWMLAKDAAEEFKPLLSSKAKLLALKTTNRLEAIDSVENLRQLAGVIDEEQGHGATDRNFHEFELRYTRAPEVVDQLEHFMGLKQDTANSQNPQQGQMRMPMMMMMQQQPGQPQPPQPTQPQKPEIHLMANTRRNSVIVHAPPDQMRIIRNAIFGLDVQSDRPSLSEHSDWAHTYRLATLDPEALATMLEGVGDLDPQTKLEIDKKNRALIVCGPPRDQKAIATMVKNLDGSDRKLKVIPLRKLDAVDVAGSLRVLLVGDDQNKNNNNNNSGFGGRRFFGGWFGGNNSNNNVEDTNTTKFRIEGDAVSNRLMVWANDIELEQVYTCLAEMGEIPRRERGHETVRVLDVDSGAEQQLLERLRNAWPAGKGNRLIIDVPPKRDQEAPHEDRPSKDDTSDKNLPTTQPAAVPSASNSSDRAPSPSARVPQASAASPAVHFAGLTRVSRSLAPALASADPAQKSESAEQDHSAQKTDPDQEDRPRTRQSNRGAAQSYPVRGAPIYITRDANGRLVISSGDTQALDQLEEMAAHLAPPKKDYELFYLQYASATSVKYNLDEFFETEKKDTSNDRMRRFWWDYDDTTTKEEPRLSRRRELRFIDDPQTNSLLVQGASGEQIRQIKDLIKVYDRPEPVNSKAARLTKLFHIHNSKASVIAEQIKEVYKDLLSANDKALESYNQSKNQSHGGRGTTFVYDLGEHEDNGKMNQQRFKGYLSMGADDSTNTLLVSCPQSLMENITQIVANLDTAAVPAQQAVQVLQIDRSIDATTLQKKLAELLKPGSTKAETPAAEQPGAEKKPQNQHRGGRNHQNQGGEEGGESNGNE